MYLRLVAIACIVPSFTAHAQQSQTLDSGYRPYGSFSGSDIDSVNLNNGNVLLHIPIASFPQRGGSLKLSYSIKSNNRGWVITQRTNPATHQPYQIWTWSPGQTGVQIVNDGALTLFPYFDSLEQTQTLFAYSLTSADGAVHYLGHA